MAVWNGLAGGVCWTYFHGPIDQPGWQSYVDHLAGLVERDLVHIATLTIVSESESPSAQQRKQLAEFMQQNASVMQGVTANAMVLDSAMARGALTALNWIFKKPFDEKVFSSMAPALDWLASKDDSIEPDTVYADLTIRVPPDQLVLP